MKLKPEAILELLRTEAVLLPIRKGTKAPNLKGWTALTFDETKTPRYQSSLERAGTIGVLLGSRSGNLCSIDFDDEDALTEFFTLNPEFAQSLRTTGRRGANIWLKLQGVYPSSFKMKRNGNPAGEWRADKSQTIITGQHKDGGEYKVIVNAPPMLVTFEEINWGELRGSKDCHIDGTNSPDNRETQISQITQKKEKEKESNRPLVEKIRGAELARMKLEGQPRLAKLYRKFIAKKFTAQQGERNSQLVAMTTFLFRATSEETTAALALFFYDLNQDTFIDSREMHENEMRSHLNATRLTWLESLGKEERQRYSELAEISQNYTNAFRLCRELADKEGLFFLSCAQMGERIGFDRQTAHRILRQFEGIGIIEMIEKGTQHRTTEQDGEKIVVQGNATVYRWLIRDT